MKTLDQMLNELSPERRQKVEDMAQEMIREIQLSKLREELNLSQQQLATALGISQPAIAKLEQKITIQDYPRSNAILKQWAVS